MDTGLHHSAATQAQAARPVWQFIADVDRWVVKVESVVASGLVLAIVLTVLTQVVMRYVFARPNPWTEELSRFSFIWLSVIGSSLATKRGAHFVFDSSVEKLSPGVRALVLRAVTALVAAMLLGVLVEGTQLASQARLQRSPALDLPMVWVYAALPISAACMLLHLVTGLAVGKEGEPAWASR